jgi:hypothetical protein
VKLSELIVRLEAAKERHGDVLVGVKDSECGLMYIRGIGLKLIEDYAGNRVLELEADL